MNEESELKDLNGFIETFFMHKFNAPSTSLKCAFVCVCVFFFVACLVLLTEINPQPSESHRTQNAENEDAKVAQKDENKRLHRKGN